MYLASAGVGEIIVVDDDTVDLTNLQKDKLRTRRRRSVWRKLIRLPKLCSL